MENKKNERILLAVNAYSDLRAGKKDVSNVYTIMTSDEMGVCSRANSEPHHECKDDLEFLKRINSFFNKWDSNNQLVFYYTGHGVIKNNNFCFEFGKNQNHSYFPFQNFINILKIAEVKKAIIIVDSCHSGQITKNASSNDYNLNKNDLPNGYVLLASSSKIEFSYEREDGAGSIFTSLVLEALQTGLRNKKTMDGYIYPNDLLNYVNNELKKENNEKYKQTPIFKVIEANEPIWISKNISGIINFTNEKNNSQVGKKAKLSYIDELTDVQSYDNERVDSFRGQLKADVFQNFPKNLSNQEFLENTSLMENGFLTHAGVLLFGKRTTARIPTAITQCVAYSGESKTAKRDSIQFENSIPEQIEAAYTFVVARMEKREFPEKEGTYSKVEYKYPLICLREIIANALVHRNYSDFTRNTHIRLFSNRIEVTSPGSWITRNKEPLEKIPLNQLQSQSVKRNYRLAKIISWIKQVELEGSGIPKSLQICNETKAPIPNVSYENKFITVTIFPKKGWSKEEPKIYEEWWAKNLIGSLGAGVFCSICAFWFEFAHPFTGFLLGGGIGSLLLLGRGNPERRFFRAASISFSVAVSVFALQVGFLFSNESFGTNSKAQTLLEWLSNYDWIISLILIVLSTGLFYLDYLRDRR